MPSPTPTPTGPVVTELSSSVNKKHPSRTFTLDVGAGELALEMTAPVKKGRRATAPTLSVEISGPDGVLVDTVSNVTPYEHSTLVAAGTHTLVVTGTRTSFTLTVTHQP